MSENPGAYQEALASCVELFQYGADIGYDFTLLDIGGGFPGEMNSHQLFGRMADAIKQSLSQYFSPTLYPHLRVIAEPGACTCTIHCVYHAHTHMHAHIHTHKNTHIYTHTHTHTRTPHTHTHTHTHTFTHTQS